MPRRSLAYVAALDEVATYRIIDGQLEFRNAAHELVKVLERD